MAGDARLSNNEMITLHEMNFEELFPTLAEEDVRLKGGPYQKGYIPLEDMLVVEPDMEAMIDARRASVSPEEFEVETQCQDARWVDFHPKMADLEPFYAVMAFADGDSFQPGFSAPSSRRMHERVVYYRGGKTIRPRKEVSP